MWYYFLWVPAPIISNSFSSSAVSRQRAEERDHPLGVRRRPPGLRICGALARARSSGPACRRPPSNPSGRHGYPQVPMRSPEPKRSGSFLRPHVCSEGRTGPPNPVSRCCLWSPPHRSPATPSHRCHDVATGRHINSNEGQLSQGYRPLPGAEPGSLWVRGGHGCNSRWVSQQDGGVTRGNGDVV